MCVCCFVLGSDFVCLCFCCFGVVHCLRFVFCGRSFSGCLFGERRFILVVVFVCVSVVGGGGIVYIRVFVSVFVGVVGLGSWVWKMWNDFVVGVSGVIVLVPR